MDGIVLRPGTGHLIGASGLTMKIGAEQSTRWSVFEAEIRPGFDVGAHVHRNVEELFYVLEGELDLLAFEPRRRSTGPGDWLTWESTSGAKVSRCGPGSLMFVPSGCPHAFFNPGPRPARMLFQVAPPGHERYQEELNDLLSQSVPPSQAAIAELRARYDTEQLTPIVPRGHAEVR